MLRELISRFTGPSIPPPDLSQVSQQSQSQFQKVGLLSPASVAKVATVAVAKVENRKIQVSDLIGVTDKGASAPGPDQGDTGLDWLPPGPDFDHPDHPGWWACFDLADLCRAHHMQVVHAGGRFLILYPVELPDGLIEYAEDLLEDGKPYLAGNLDRLPILTPAGAVTEIKRIMNAHKGLKFTKGDDGSRWPIYPRTWTAGQKATLQALWFAAGDALDNDDFMEIDR